MNSRIVGVVIVSKFIAASSKKFNQYINYIGRDEAVRNKYFSRYSLYEDYMGNPDKTTGLFDKYTDIMSDEDKKHAQKMFEKAQKNDSILWQDVFSFDNRWLTEQGLYNPATGELDEKKIKDAVRKSIEYSLEKKNMKESAIWNGAIHYNTDNIHIHVAICEPEPSQQRGKRTQKTLDNMKSIFVNELLDSRKNYELINSIIRDRIIGKKEDRQIICDRKMKRMLMDVKRNLPNDKRHWKYGYNTMKNANTRLDKMTKYYIETYKKDEYRELLKHLDKQEKILMESYGIGDRKKFEDYKKNKIEELYKRMGNAILNEMKTIEEEKTYTKKRTFKSRYRKNILLLKDLKKIEKALGNEFESMKNIREYERLNQRIENEIEM